MKNASVIFFFLMISIKAFGWGALGHETVAHTAAQLLERKAGMTYLLDSSFTLGYYSNAPDKIWKNINKETYQKERDQHYLDWSDKLIKVFSKPQNLPIDFEEYKKIMGEAFAVSDGISPWRIQQLFNMAIEQTRDLTFEKQGPLLLYAGLLSHYTGDLSQPLHVTDNFDGQLTHQQGIHSYFEDNVIDLLYPEIKVEVLKAALVLYEKEVKKRRDYHRVVRDLIQISNGRVPELLTLDKKWGRAKTRKNAQNYREFAVRCLAQGAVSTALVWKEIFENVKEFNMNKFFYFDGKPEYIRPVN